MCVAMIEYLIGGDVLKGEGELLGSWSGNTSVEKYYTREHYHMVGDPGCCHMVDDNTWGHMYERSHDRRSNRI